MEIYHKNCLFTDSSPSPEPLKSTFSGQNDYVIQREKNSCQWITMATPPGKLWSSWMTGVSSVRDATVTNKLFMKNSLFASHDLKFDSGERFSDLLNGTRAPCQLVEMFWNQISRIPHFDQRMDSVWVRIVWRKLLQKEELTTGLNMSVSGNCLFIHQTPLWSF